MSRGLKGKEEASARVPTPDKVRNSLNQYVTRAGSGVCVIGKSGAVVGRVVITIYLEKQPT